ncbi:hypothetical protein LTR70_001375 [Exophiala xenobiotica]|uniref:Uncharacterized protein n=1 Tax=Lithohypha guttulata TaxID=1690604 RepID=A0ABR0KMB8_9EURO|nr:hypothetical protein LTR24_000870 [Lithohypha guttulata]KAK5328054.1 hypothetical protein LTR70_001375 [Exophiala xenobiotica]
MTTFADVLPIRQLESHKYSANFESDWCIGTVPNGGYVTASFMLVASKHMQLTHSTRKQLHVVNLHLQFMRRTGIGEAIFTVKDVKLGGRISNLHLTLTQKDERSGKMVEEVMGYIMMSDMSAEDGLSLDSGYEMSPEPLPVSLPALVEGKDANYVRRGRDPFADFRRAGRHMAMHLVRPDKRPSHFPKAMIDQWVLFQPQGREGRHTNNALGYIVDIFPQILERYVNAEMEEACLGQDLSAEEAEALIKNRAQPNAKYWYPTLNLNLDVKKLLPEEGVKWLFVRVQAKKIQNGRFDLEVTVLDESGDIVALSTHSALAVDSSRNTTREKKDSKSKL